MNKRKLVISLVVLALLVAAVVSVVCADLADRRALEGLYGVEVVVEGRNPEVEKAGLLTDDDLQTAVELRLRQLHIRVLTEEEGSRAAAHPHLYVNINILDKPQYAGATMVYSVTVEHNEQMRQIRKPYGLRFGSTWGTGSVGTGRAEDIKGHVLEKVDEYANDYLAANPNKQ
jgi:hypothetical protein